MDRTTRHLLVLVALFGTAYALLARFALHAFPFSGDEYSYLLQGELFARGHLHAPAPPHAELLGVDHVLLSPTVCSKYPPGTSALLAIGVGCGVPWLVTPIEGAIALLAMGVAVRRVLGERPVLIAVALLGVAPLFAFQAASFFSHTATTMWLTIAFALVAAWSEDRHDWRMIVAGAAVGCAFLTRPVDAVLFGVALCAFASIRVVLLAGLGAAPFAALLLAYQAAQFGSPFTTGYAAYEPTLRAIYGGSPPPLSLKNLIYTDKIWEHVDAVRGLVVEWTVPGTAVLALLGWAAIQEREAALPVRRFATVLLALVLAAFLVTAAGQDEGARPRYLSTALISLAWLGAPGWTTAVDILTTRMGAAARWALAVALGALPAVELSLYVGNRNPAAEARAGLVRKVADEGIADGLVVVRAWSPTRYARNGPFFERPVLYLSPPEGTDIAKVRAAFPGHPVYEAREDGGKWTITRVP